MSKKKLTQEEVEARFLEKGLRLVEKYKNCNTKVKTECPFCHKIFLARPRLVFIGDIKSCGCHNFSKLTQEEVKEKAIKYNIKIIGKYQHSHQKIKCICPICQQEFFAIPYDIIRGRVKSCGCLQNFVDKTKLSQYEAEIRSLDIGIKLIGEYKASYIKTQFICPVCKSIFLCAPKNIWNQHIKSCGNCKYHHIKIGNKIGKYTIIKLKKTKYKGYYLEAKCECGYIWKGLRNKFIKHEHKYCKQCGLVINGKRVLIQRGIITSNPAIKLQTMINNEGIHNYRVGKYSIDIALARNNSKIAIEYDEWFWHGHRIEQDRLKRRYLTKKGWKILRIKAHGNLPTQKQLDEALYELIYTKRKKYTITLTNWGIGKTRFDNKDKQ